MYAATLSSKYQLVIPKQIRTELEYHAGQKLIMIPKGNVLMLIPQASLKDIKGWMSGANTENYREHKDRI